MAKTAHVRVTLTSIVVQFDNFTMFSVPLRFWERVEHQGASRWRSRSRSASEVKMIVSRLKSAIQNAAEETLNKQLLRTRLTHQAHFRNLADVTLASDDNAVPDEILRNGRNKIPDILLNGSANHRVVTRLAKGSKRQQSALKQWRCPLPRFRRSKSSETGLRVAQR